MAHEDPSLEYETFKYAGNWKELPRTRREEVVAFLEKGVVPKGFIYELFCDNFMSAVAQCPEDEVGDLPKWAALLRDDVPMASRGNKIQVESFARHRRELTSGG